MLGRWLPCGSLSVKSVVAPDETGCPCQSLGRAQPTERLRTYHDVTAAACFPSTSPAACGPGAPACPAAAKLGASVRAGFILVNARGQAFARQERRRTVQSWCV